MRWRLTQKHYLNVPGTYWEYSEVSTRTRRSIKKRFDVGRYLDPDDPNDHNHTDQIIVAREDGAHEPNDIIFLGPPTLDMVPLDDEAKAESAKMAEGWNRQFVSEDDEGGYTSRLLLELTETLGSFNNNKPSGMIPDEGMVEVIKQQQEQINQLISALSTLATNISTTATTGTFPRR